MLARRPSWSCDFKVLNKMLISDIIGLQLIIAIIQGTQQCSDLDLMPNFNFCCVCVCV